MAYGVYRNLDLRIANPMMAALEGYKGVDSIIKDNEDRKIAALDRDRRITREDAQETRAQAQEGRLVSGEERAQALHQQTMRAMDDQKAVNVLRGEQVFIDEAIVKGVRWEDYYNSRPKAIRDIYDNLYGQHPAFKDEEALKKTAEAPDRLEEAIVGGDKKTILDIVNHTESASLNIGGSKPGTTPISKKAVDYKIVPDGPNAGMLAVEVEVTAKNDKTGQETTYKSWVTVNRSGDENDPIKLIDPGAQAAAIGRMGYMAKGLLAERIARGDIEAYRENKQKGDNKKQSAALVKMLDGVDMRQGYDKALTQASALAAPLLESGDVTFAQIGAALDVKFKAHKADVDQKNKERDQEIEAAKADATRATATGGLKLKDVKADVESLIKSLASAQRGENMNSMILERLDKNGYAKSIEGLKNAIRDNLRLLDSQYDGAGRAIYKSQYQKGGLMYGPKTIKPTGKLPPDIKVGDVRELNGTIYRYIGDGQLEEVVQ